MDLSNLFSSKSKYRILRVLSVHRSPIHLRAIADLAKVQVRSAQLALKSLHDAKVITKSREENRVIFQLNKRSNFFNSILEHFEDEQNRELKARAKYYNDPKQVIEVIEQLLMLKRNAKRVPN